MIKLMSQINMATGEPERQFKHIPVMLDEVITHLDLKAGGLYVDGTLGLGGHALGILNRIGPRGRVIGIDRDGQSLTEAGHRLGAYAHQCFFIKEDFRNMDKVLDQLQITHVDGILLDLGISSFQLDDTERGFSLRLDGPLDMRMDQESYISAYDLINSLSERELSLILKDFGEERWHKRIAKLLVDERAKKPIDSTKVLSQLIMKAMPFAARHAQERIHPATRTFQAFRIAVNRELEALEIALDKCIHYLRPGGRLVVISFHSLEDRIVKHKMQEWERYQQIKTLTKKPLRPSLHETELNPRSRSARLRAAEKIK